MQKNIDPVTFSGFGWPDGPENCAENDTWYKCINPGGKLRKPSRVTYIFFCRVTLKFDEWLCKTMGHLFYATWSFVHRFVTISKFKLEL